ncbi:class I adenylate-forming enzyme family protein [Actinomadura rugatobispora]|uniref:Class I adenylate-forming enzyme family protein n=1 Tax=Actinomadura rugatobispora TaxID=1994 RepID=A0ABW1AFX5_9ACTN|nr:AMP-binding protein [Actinomadura rugatobispora]
MSGGGLGRAVADGLRAAADREVLVRGDRRLRGDEVLAMVEAGVERLTARGVRPGATVACLYGEAPESVAARLVALALGCRFVHLVQDVPVPIAAETMRALDASALLWDPAREPDAGPLLAACPVPVRARLDAGLFAPTTAGPVDMPGPDDAPDATSVVMFSSGTTGPRKAVAYGHGTEAAHLTAARAIFGPGPWRLLVAPRARYLPGLFTLWTLAGGGTVVLEPALGDARRLARLVDREGVTHCMAGRPLAVYGLARDLDAPLTGLRQLLYGGTAAYPARTAAAGRRLGPVLTQTYGITEGGFLTVLTADDHHRTELLGSVGRAVPGVEIRVRDSRGGDLPRGETGEVWVRTGQRMLGYVNAPGRTSRTVPGGWLRTGDLGRLDAEGYLFLSDRAATAPPVR